MPTSLTGRATRRWLLASWLLSGTAFAELPQIHDATIPQPPPGASVAAGFFTIENPADEPLAITDVTVDGSGPMRAELHLSSVVDDVARMERQSKIVVPARASLAFEHGGYHVMLMDLDHALLPGDSVAVTLETSIGPIAVRFPVRGPGGMSREMKHGGLNKADGGMDPALDSEMRHEDQGGEGAASTPAR